DDREEPVRPFHVDGTEVGFRKLPERAFDRAQGPGHMEASFAACDAPRRTDVIQPPGQDGSGRFQPLSGVRFEGPHSGNTSHGLAFAIAAPSSISLTNP